MRKHRVAATAALLVATGSLSTPVIAQAVTATTFYVNNASSANCSDSTTDSSTTPYCTIQAAVNVATTPGDTVIVAQGSYAAFEVTASGTDAAPITIEGTGANLKGSGNTRVRATSSVAAVTLSGASYVNVKELSLYNSYGSGLSITGSTQVSLDSSYVIAAESTTATAPAISLNSGSSYVTISRDYVRSSSTGAAIATDGGSNDVITTTSVIGSNYGPGIFLDQTTASDITSNTVVFGCGADIAVTGGSTSSSVENNLAVQMYGPSKYCTATAGASAALEVDSSSVSGTIADYNEVASEVSGIADYAWAGKYYSSTTAFTAATGQGAHDASPSVPTAAVDSANSAAPGELSTDMWGDIRVDDPEVANTGVGAYSYYDRGAAESIDPLTVTHAANWPSMAPVSGLGTYAATITDPWGNTVTGCTYNFGDGTASVAVTPVSGVCSAQHAYAATGSYTPALTMALSDGEYVTNTNASVNVVNASAFTAALSLSASGARGVSADASASSDDWSIESVTYDFGDGTTSTAANAYVGTGHTYAAPGKYTVKVTETDVDGNQATASGSVTTAGSYYTPVTPNRILDTRKAIGVTSVAKVAAGGTVRLKVAGVQGVPNGVTAVTLNVTVTNAAKGGDIVAYPDGAAVPNASNLNFAAGQTAANTVVVEVGSDGYVDLVNQNSGTIDLIADLEGYYSLNGTSGYQTITPTRLLDTRTTKTPVKAGGTVRLSLGSAAGASAAALNVTVTGPTGGGHVTAYPDGATLPDTSNVNFGVGQTVANETIVKVGSNGYVDFTNTGTGTLNLIVDLTGYFTIGSGAAFMPITPTRYLDTRNGIGAVLGGDNYAPFASHETRDVEIANICPLATGCLTTTMLPSSATAVAANVTVTAPTNGGYVAAYPDSVSTVPNASLVNFSAGQTIPNAATVGLGGTNGGLDLYNGSPGYVQLIVDVSGYYG